MSMDECDPISWTKDEWIIVKEIDYKKIDQCHQLDEIYKFIHGYVWTWFKISCMKTTSMNDF
jgi:hypothetical protein